ncbi:uncharacterized protein AMSG_04315 [Thecamonas trahens ATCC 50062]|uniref:Uncharacterized protein n=1 Tax=Thecamonas trahens ATCC 50062 TaxID=461836 RepID=A0A0L0D7C6_THETB|nr:hypothetical protein AMSG_04315 [Thecamonas trahens ATCC 50062]KNC48085.1 hypothetical protein AMSG_04315 [Thecamonas trahens ATCC 50062]|eukprot:XP_013759098.1 hypothetical protein AMSG_04315 [Thecamonas trahens ATCC 50062]
MLVIRRHGGNGVNDPGSCMSLMAKLAFAYLAFINLLVAILLIWTSVDVIYQVTSYRPTSCSVSEGWVRPYDSLSSPTYSVMLNVEYNVDARTVATSYTVEDLDKKEFERLCRVLWGCAPNDDGSPFELSTLAIVPLRTQAVHECWFDPNSVEAASIRPTYSTWNVFSFILFPINWILGIVFTAVLIRSIRQDCTQQRDRQQVLRRIVANHQERRAAALAALGDPRQRGGADGGEANSDGGEDAAAGDDAAGPSDAAADGGESTAATPTPRPDAAVERGELGRGGSGEGDTEPAADDVAMDDFSRSSFDSSDDGDDLVVAMAPAP